MVNWNNPEEVKEYYRKYRQEHKEEIRKYGKKYRQEHKEEIRKRTKKYRQEHKEETREYNKKYRQEHKEEMREYNKKYRQDHKEEIRKCKREEYWRNPEKIRKRKREEYWRNPERYCEQGRKRRKTSRGNASTQITSAKMNYPWVKHKITVEEWKEKKEATKGICPCCKIKVGIKLLTLDHAISPTLISKDNLDFTYYIDDIQPLCGSCNDAKHFPVYL